MKDLQTERARRHALTWAVNLTAGTSRAPDHYERGLLERYAQQTLTLAQVLTLLDNRVHHLLYQSQAVHPLSQADLAELAEQSQAWNAAHHITGLLCYRAFL